MKKFSTLLMFLVLAVGIGCNQEQPITQLEVGREKLLGAGLSIEAVEHLKRAETEEAKTPAEKIEPRVLLLIAYSHAISTGDARTQRVEAEYKQARDERIAALKDTEMKKMLQLLAQRYRTQASTMQILVDKGAGAVPVLIEYLGIRRYLALRNDLVEMLYQIGSEGVNHITTTLSDTNTSPEMKVILTRLIGRINDSSAIPALEAIQSGSAPGLRMEINIALYNLGREEYRTQIITGLSDNDVTVRRAAAQAMLRLDNPPADELVKALSDADASVRMYAGQTLEKYPTENAISRLVEILISDTDEAVKDAASKALIIHGEQDFGKGIAQVLIKALPGVGDPKDRIRMVLILKREAFMEQIKNAPKAHDDNIEYDLFLYFNQEQNDMVKEELSMLLNNLRR